jgi:hypothetical protein
MRAAERQDIVVLQIQGDVEPALIEESRVHLQQAVASTLFRSCDEGGCPGNIVVRNGRGRQRVMHRDQRICGEGLIVLREPGGNPPGAALLVGYMRSLMVHSG